MSSLYVTSSSLPITDITKDNVAEEWNSLITTLKKSTFIAIDIEMSGLGNRKNLNQQSIEDRYKSISQLANTFSVLSFGISCFTINKPEESNQNIQVENKTFNILTFTEEFLVEAKSLKFLIDHGFDFNKLFSKGLRHYRGNDKSTDDVNNYNIRTLINEISEAKIPIVLHNGFIDLIFIYQNFYAELPDTSIKFLADLEEIFSGGIYDTKFIAEFHYHSNASFLEYLYKKALYDNTQKIKSLFYINVLFSLNEVVLKLSDFSLDLKKDLLADKKICINYSTYGFCAKIETCKKSHDLNAVIQAELNKKKSKKQRTEEHQIEIVETEIEISNHENDVNQTHSAGLDSFMTGFVMLTYLNKLTKFKTIEQSSNIGLIHLLNDFDLEEIKNKVYLTGKDYPLMVRKSNFASTSLNHKEKQKK